MGDDSQEYPFLNKLIYKWEMPKQSKHFYESAFFIFYSIRANILIFSALLWFVTKFCKKLNLIEFRGTRCNMNISFEVQWTDWCGQKN